MPMQSGWLNKNDFFRVIRSFLQLEVELLPKLLFRKKIPDNFIQANL
jgi:hypothetical protein